MADTTNQSNRYPNLTTDELEIIGYFAKGQKYSIPSQSLKLECGETSIRLVDPKGKLIGISKQTSEWQRKVLINSNSTYTSSIVELLTDSGFITKQNSSHPDFTEHHYYQVPNGYKLNHTDVLQLWKIWWNNKRYQLNARNLPIDVLVFSKGNWCVVQDLQPKQGNFVLKTHRGELTILAEDLVVWIDKSAPQTITASEPSSPVVKQVVSVSEPSSSVTNQIASVAAPSSPQLTDLPSETNIPTEVIAIPTSPVTRVSPPINALPIDSTDNINHKNGSEYSEYAEDLDLESYLSTFNTEDTEDIDRIEGIYNIKELLSSTVGDDDIVPPPAPPKPTFRIEVSVVAPQASVKPQVPPTVKPASVQSQVPPVVSATPKQSSTAPVEIQIPISIAERKRSLKVKAMNTLTTYLQDGEAVTQTEVLKNGQGQVINRKMTTTKRDCPGWTIDQIKKLEEELAGI
jgi:hypothetical protein